MSFSTHNFILSICVILVMVTVYLHACVVVISLLTCLPYRSWLGSSAWHEFFFCSWSWITGLCFFGLVLGICVTPTRHRRPSYPCRPDTTRDTTRDMGRIRYRENGLAVVVVAGKITEDVSKFVSPRMILQFRRFVSGTDWWVWEEKWKNRHRCRRCRRRRWRRRYWLLDWSGVQLTHILILY